MGGFIGSHVCDALVSAGHDVRIFEKDHVSKENVEHLISSVEWVEGDFTNQTHLKEIVKGCRHNYSFYRHYASENLSNENPVYDISSQIHLYTIFIESARDLSEGYILSSGGTVYGIPQTIPIPEDHPTEPICSYGIQNWRLRSTLTILSSLWA